MKWPLKSPAAQWYQVTGLNPEDGREGRRQFVSLDVPSCNQVGRNEDILKRCSGCQTNETVDPKALVFSQESHAGEEKS